MTTPNLGDLVKLKDNPRAGLLKVVSVFLEGEEPWVALQVGKAQSSKGALIHRPVADLEIT